MATPIRRIRTADRPQHATLEQLLSQQRTMLRNRKHVLQDALPTPTSGVLDAEEHSKNAGEQSVGFSMLALTFQTVQEIETALRRLTAGEFGTCPDCRARISDARLRALPFASLCLACQQQHDIASGALTRAASRWQ